MVTAVNIVPAPSALGLPRDTAVSFDLTSASNISFVAVIVKYENERRRLMVFETDGFIPPYDESSSISGLGTTTVSISAFEPGGWRAKLSELRAVGIDAGGSTFDLEVTRI